MKLTIATPERKIAGEVPVKLVTIPTIKGEITILPGHAQFLGVIGVGIITFEQDNGKKQTGHIAHGFVQVFGDEVMLLADRLELSSEIDIERAKKAEAKATEALKAKSNFDEDHSKWVAKLERAKMRQLASKTLPIQ